MQRIIDIILSGIALIFLAPLLFAIIIILSLTGEKEIFFLQERIGKNSRIFKVYKFATMLKNSPNMGPGTLTMKNDPRVLPFGKFALKRQCNVFFPFFVSTHGIYIITKP